jgi:hypothetical protein
MEPGGPWTLTFEAWRLKSKQIRGGPVDFEEEQDPDPDPHHSEKSDPDLH